MSHLMMKKNIVAMIMPTKDAFNFFFEMKYGVNIPTRIATSKLFISTGYSIISEHSFDVVLTDLMMPGGVDGIGVLEAVKEKYSRTEVILITAYASVDNAVEAMKKGATDYLQKPINFDELFLRLDKISHLKKLMKDAGDLREAMDVTERSAGQTIQDLEMTVSQLQNSLFDVSHILSKNSIDAGTRVAMALDTLS